MLYWYKNLLPDNDELLFELGSIWLHTSLALLAAVACEQMEVHQVHMGV
jgi:hypothetical protein